MPLKIENEVYLFTYTIAQFTYLNSCEIWFLDEKEEKNIDCLLAMVYTNKDACKGCRKQTNDFSDVGYICFI